jgi:hypothetical protein
MGTSQDERSQDDSQDDSQDERSGRVRFVQGDVSGIREIPCRPNRDQQCRRATPPAAAERSVSTARRVATDKLMALKHARELRAWVARMRAARVPEKRGRFTVVYQ